MQRFFQTWVKTVQRFAWGVVLLSAISAALTVTYLQRNLAVNTDTTDMLSADLPFRKNNSQVDRLFPQLNDTLLLMFDGNVPERVDAAAEKLVTALRAQPAIYGNIFDPEGDPFLQRNGLLFLDVAELEAMTGRLADAQPFLASLWTNPGLDTLFDLLRQGLERHLEGEADTLGLARVLGEFSEVAERQRAGEDQQLSWQRLLGETGDPTEPVRRMIVLQPPLDFGSLQPASKTLDALIALRHAQKLDGSAGPRLRISGGVAMQQDELQSVEQGMGLAGILSLVLVIVLLGVCLRTPATVFAVLATLIVGLIWTAGFAIWAFGALNLISVAFAVLFIGLSVDFGIHYCLRFGEFRSRGLGTNEALENAAGAGGGGLTLCAVAAAMAFYSFLPTDYVGLAQLGLIAGTGMFIALFANLTLLPALLAVLPVGAPTGPGSRGAISGLTRVIQAKPKAVLIGAAALAVVGLAIIPQARFDFDPLNLQDARLESVAVVHELAKGEGASTYTATVLADSVGSADRLAERLRGIALVDKVVSIESFLPKDQKEKVEIIQDLALFLLPSLDGAPRKSTATPETIRKAITELAPVLSEVAESKGQDGLSHAAMRLKNVLDRIETSELKRLETALLGTFPRTVGRLRLALNPTRVTLSELPADLRDRYLSPGGKVRMSVYPKEDLRDPAAVARFVAAVRAVAPDASGAPVTIYEAGRTVVAAFAQAGSIAVIAILVLLYAVLRRLSDVALVFVPLALAALLTGVFSVGFAVPFNFANIIVLPLLFGLGVASGIHLILRDRAESEGGPGGDAFTTSTPRAVMFSALTTIGSFGSIALSGHPGTASMGVLLTVAIILTLGCTLVLLPAFLVLRRRNGVAPPV